MHEQTPETRVPGQPLSQPMLMPDSLDLRTHAYQRRSQFPARRLTPSALGLGDVLLQQGSQRMPSNTRPHQAFNVHPPSSVTSEIDRRSRADSDRRKLWREDPVGGHGTSLRSCTAWQVH
jgi:hypothetical protein